MIKTNRVVYFLINIFWAISLLLSIPYLFKTANGQAFAYVNSTVILLMLLIQFYGAYSLFKKKYLVPIIATAFFVLNFDFIGFKLITNTLLYFKTEFFINGNFSLNIQLDDPNAIINLSFKEFSFKMIGLNVLAVLQIAGLIAERNKREINETYT